MIGFRVPQCVKKIGFGVQGSEFSVLVQGAATQTRRAEPRTNPERRTENEPCTLNPER